MPGAMLSRPAKPSAEVRHSRHPAPFIGSIARLSFGAVPHTHLCLRCRPALASAHKKAPEPLYAFF
jgi:hypothetical protein